MNKIWDRFGNQAEGTIISLASGPSQ